MEKGKRLKNSSFNSLNQINSDDPAHIHLLLQEIGKKTDVLDACLRKSEWISPLPP